MSLSVTILGSSSALPTSERNPTAHLVNHDERFFLVDCGEGTQIQMRRFMRKFSSINHIFISHLHGDHVFGLFGLISTYSLLGRKEDLHVYSNPQLQEILDVHLKYFGQDMSYKVVVHPIDYKQQQLIYEDKKLTVTTILLKHRIPCVGFLFREKENERNMRKEMIAKYKLGIADIVKLKRGEDYISEKGDIIPNSELTAPAVKPLSYAFCTDTRFHESIIEQVKDVDLLYYESTFRKEEVKLAKETYHSTSEQAATVAKMANAGKLIIGHFSSRYKDVNTLLTEAREVFPQTYLAKDGDEHVVTHASGS